MLFVVSIENLKNLKCHTFSKKQCSKCENEYEKIFKEKESTEISKIIGSIKNI